MGYPERIVVEGFSVEVVDLKLIPRVDYGCNAIDALHDFEPVQHVALKLGQGFVASFFDVKEGGQVAFLQVDLLEEEFGLTGRVLV